MKRAIKAIDFTQVNNYFGEFHTLVFNRKVMKFSTEILPG